MEREGGRERENYALDPSQARVWAAELSATFPSRLSIPPNIDWFSFAAVIATATRTAFFSLFAFLFPFPLLLTTKEGENKTKKKKQKNKNSDPRNGIPLLQTKDGLVGDTLPRLLRNHFFAAKAARAY